MLTQKKAGAWHALECRDDRSRFCDLCPGRPFKFTGHASMAMRMDTCAHRASIVALTGSSHRGAAKAKTGV